MVSGTRCPYVSVCGCEVVRGAAAPKGLMTYAVGPGGLDMGLRVRFKNWTRGHMLNTGIEP